MSYIEKHFRMNSCPVDLFKVPATLEGMQRERADIITGARMLAMEAAGARLNSRLASLGENKYAEPYVKMLTPEKYRSLNELTRDKRLLFAAQITARQEAKVEPQTVDEVKKMARDYFNNPLFVQTLAGIDSEVIRPILPYVLTNALGPLARMVEVAAGETYEADVLSNDIFVFQDSAWGSHRAAPMNRLYSYPITLNPRPYTAQAKIKFRQMLSSEEDLGDYYNAIMAGWGNKITAMWIEAMSNASTNAFFVPSAFKFNGSTTANLITASKMVSMVNHIDRNSVMIFGDVSPLSRILPSGTTQDAALTYALGGEWFNQGYMGTVYGMRTFAIDPSVVPGTQNTTADSLIPTNVLYLAGMPNRNVQAPIWIAMEENTPISIEFGPMLSNEMAITVNVIANMDVKPVVSSKIAVITNA